MTRFSRALIIGDSGGIGGAIADRLREFGVEVVGLSRRSDPPLDLEDEASIEQAIGAQKGEFDLLFIASGLLHDGEHQPEKSNRALSKTGLDRAFAVNATGPALVIKYALPLIPRDRPAAIAALSARVGSIGDNRLGGWHAYRASKAALNMLLKTMAIELARTHKQLVVTAMHPGTVDTTLSEPFQGNVPEGQLFTREQSARHLLDVLETLGPEDTGGHVDWAGKLIVP
ncbi:SDR family NAD(P)-dependent oxidoreductase [Sphingomicrobium clamense]|uniref:SDR family NAD(P)-dependent oxidoreductase n=1 Tax=Sphingomicrobium clamense TaxID=2851013 RepID=A0ABS6V7Y8_9SPHN|nr:SDR family NAD(P)-dependent oxidoreductase [Sphingomicrobium sp. B8]MBW0145697.1 SDR family NAD(P)-dependent oxidoreductase [Sphingomicrobium sp. B8]